MGALGGGALGAGGGYLMSGKGGPLAPTDAKKGLSRGQVAALGAGGTALAGAGYAAHRNRGAIERGIKSIIPERYHSALPEWYGTDAGGTYGGGKQRSPNFDFGKTIGDLFGGKKKPPVASHEQRPLEEITGSKQNFLPFKE